MPDQNPIIARLPDGTELRFPPGTPENVISRVIREETGQSRGPMDLMHGIGAEASGLAQGLRSAGNTGLNTILGGARAAAGFDLENFAKQDPGMQAVGNTVKGVGSLIGGVGEAAFESAKHGELPWEGHGLVSAAQNPAIRGIANEYAGRYGSWENTKDTFFGRPLTMLSDVATVVSPALKAGGAAAAARGMTGTARAAAIANDVINPLEGVSDMSKVVAGWTGPKFQNFARGRFRNSLGLSPADMENKASAVSAVDAMAEHGTLPTVGGLRKTQGRIKGLQAENEAVFAANPGARGTTATPELNDWVTERRGTQRIDPEGLAGALDVQESATTLGPHQQPTYGFRNGQWTQTGTRLPSTLPVGVLQDERNRLGRVLNKTYQAGENVPPSFVTDAKKRLYTDLKDSVHAALPDTIPIDAKLSPLHSLEAQLKRGPLASRSSQSAYPGARAQAASLVGRGMGTGEALLGHGVNRMGGGLSRFGATPNTYTGMAPQAFAAGGLLEDVEAATKADAKRQADDARRNKFRALSGVRF